MQEKRRQRLAIEMVLPYLRQLSLIQKYATKYKIKPLLHKYVEL